ncbi:MAG TPA: aldolase/citrate lyase family protein [Acetobacteraceae bacterium]|nr:aldolase/citrate lyase family protein [Acetobacteraceae bacterium]
MTTLRNSAREKLADGGLAIGFSVRLLRTVEVAPAAKAAGFDWLWLDCEHGTLSLDQAAQIAVAALECGIAPIVRVPNGEYSLATRILDNGALGIVIPHVDTAEEAKEVVQKLKYPPVGHRSIGGIGPHYGLRSLKVGDAAAVLNAANLTIVMLETPKAIENADAIAAVPGIDVLLIGTNDLCAEMGIPGEFTHDRVAAAYGTMIAACRNHGKHPGMAGIYTESIMQRYIAMGASFVLGGGDAAFVMAAATSRATNLRKMASA